MRAPGARLCGLAVNAETDRPAEDVVVARLDRPQTLEPRFAVLDERVPMARRLEKKIAEP